MKLYRYFCYTSALLLTAIAVYFLLTGHGWQGLVVAGCGGVWAWNARRGYGA